MRITSICIVCLLIIGFLGCSLISAKTNKKRDLYMHSFTCDSLGVEKTVFDRNEKWYAGFVIRNDSKHPIKYKILHPMVLAVDYFKTGGRPGIMTFGELDIDGDLPEYNLDPNEQIYEVRKCHHETNIETGKYKAKMYNFIIFMNDKYEKQACSQLRRYIPFDVK